MARGWRGKRCWNLGDEGTNKQIIRKPKREQGNSMGETVLSSLLPSPQANVLKLGAVAKTS